MLKFKLLLMSINLFFFLIKLCIYFCRMTAAKYMNKRNVVIVILKSCKNSQFALLVCFRQMVRIYSNVILKQLYEIWLIPKTVDVLCNLAGCGCMQTGAGRGTLGAFLRSAGRHASLTVVVLFRYSCLISLVSAVGSILGLEEKKKHPLYKKDYVLWKACDIRIWPVCTNCCIINVKTHTCCGEHSFPDWRGADDSRST